MQGSPRIDELRQKFHENPRRYFAPLANEYRKAGDPEQAIAICRAHLAQQPGHMSGHVVYGQALYDARRPDEARAVFEKALSLDPDNAIVLSQLGDIARESGDTTEARHWYSKALDIDPHDTEAAAYVAELAEPLVTDAEAADVVDTADTADTAETADTADSAETAAVADTAETPLVAEEAVVEPAVAFAAEETAEVPQVAELEGVDEMPPHEESEHADADDVAWRKTPQPEESPFVTRTMADLYARQGHREAALDVYRQLAIHHPDDDEIRGRIEELSAEPAAPGQADAISPLDPGKHFTEFELSEGDTWDSDSWAAGFTPGEAINLEFDTADTGTADTGTADVAAAASEESVEPSAAAEESEPEEEAVETGFVAYSPEAPPDHELSHFTLKPPTIRELFRALGARRPPARDAVQSYTARAAVPSGDPGRSSDYAPSGNEGAVNAEDYPMAADAFANLFPESAVSEDDTRAAFALSGALSGAAHSPLPSTVQTSPPRPSPAVTVETPGPNEESEDEIRRFREWLDGLAES